MQKPTHTMIAKLEVDLAVRLPTSGKPIPVITFSRKEAEQLLKEIRELQKRASAKLCRER
jgi:hypothetical protein